MTDEEKTFWQANPDLANKYSSPLDRTLYCDQPLIQLLDIQPSDSVLDIGSGNGVLSVQLANLASKVVGVDSSEAMLTQAQEITSFAPNLSFQLGKAELLSIPDSSFDKAVACMVVNTINNEETVKKVFQEAYRVLKVGGKFVVALAHPLTLDQKTKFRWTEWVEGQTQQNLKPGDEIKRCFVGKNGEILHVPNYYWPPDALKSFALFAGFQNEKVLEPKATSEDLKNHPELEPLLTTTSFFLLMSFDKPN